MKQGLSLKEMEKSEKENNSSNTQVFSVEHEGHVNNHQHLTSSHTVDHDSWLQVGLMLVTCFSCGYVLSFSNLILVPLGWAWGLFCLTVFGFFTAYANWLLAGLHIIDGQRFLRYRDLMGFVFGGHMYYVTWALQFFTLLLGNMGFILLGGRALKEIHSELSGSPWRLQYHIILTGVIFFVFAFLVPTMSAMRKWLGISALLTFIYTAVLSVILVKDRNSNTNVDYNTKGSMQDKIFNAFGAIAAIVVCNTSGLLPEIQSTLHKPAIKNMRKALYLQYSAGILIYYGVTIAGYWGYGSLASEYLPKDLSGPKWAKILINSAVFLQAIVSQQMFISPIHEALDTKFLNLNQKIWSMDNLKSRFILRMLFFAVITIITAAFPFMGDFVNLCGSFTLFPLTFVFPSMIFIKVKGKTAKQYQKLWHWSNIVVFSLIAVVTTISAIRLIVNNARMYQFFANT